MKAKTYLHALLALSLACAATACDENAWNDKLDGWDDFENQPITEVKSVEYTLTDANYGSIANLDANKALAGAEGKDALANVGSLKRFSKEAPASVYVPAFLSTSDFPYFTLTNGSSVKLTYRVAENEPETYLAAANAQSISVNKAFYQEEVWASENYVEAFAPSKKPSDYLPLFVSDEVDPANGSVVVVSYKMATQEPVFGGGDVPEEPEFTLGSAIASLKINDNANFNAVVTAICKQGYMVADNSGAILVYMGSSFDPTTVTIGQQVTVAGTIGSYNKGLQVTGSSATVEVVGEQAVTYPTPKVFTGADLDAAITRTDDRIAVYGKVSGKVAFSYDKEDATKVRNINILVDGAETAQASVYQFTDSEIAMFTDGATQTIEGYFIAIAGTRYVNFVVTSVDGKACFTPAVAKAPAYKATPYVPTETLNAIYVFDGTRWNEAEADYVVLNPADYTAMGQKYANLSEAEPYLSTYLKVKQPYAAEGDIMYVMWLKYANSKSTYQCSAYKYDGAAWTPYNFTVTETNQFVMTGGKWMYDPNVTITLPAGKSQPLSTLYFQTCVDWVFENICKPLGDTDIKSGKFYISSYGNNEYYSGTSAYQGNVDLRASAALSQYAAGYEGMSDEQIVELEKKRFMFEVMPGALSIIHNDAKPIDGIDVLYIINFGVYNGSGTVTETATFKVVAPGKFEPVSCTWWPDSKLPE